MKYSAYMTCWILGFVFSVIALSGCGEPEIDTKNVAVPVQKVSGFHRPESCTVGVDGRFLYVTNCASGLYGEKKLFALASKKGSISRLTIGDDGTLAMTHPEYVMHMSAPLGICAMPVSTKKYPRGTLFVNVGYFKQTGENNEYLKLPRDLGTGTLVINPKNGEIIGKIDLGLGSYIAEKRGSQFLVPNGMAFDDFGNLYIVETGADSGKLFEKQIISSGGILRIDHKAIDTLAAGKDHDGFMFMPMSGNPNGVMYDHPTDSIYVVTCGGDDDPFRGAVFRIPRNQFGPGRFAPPLARDMGQCDGVVRTKKGTLIISLYKGGLYAVFPDGKKEKVQFSEPVDFQYAADIKLMKARDGKVYLLLPEQDFMCPNYRRQQLWRIALPEKY